MTHTKDQRKYRQRYIAVGTWCGWLAGFGLGVMISAARPFQERAA